MTDASEKVSAPSPTERARFEAETARIARLSRRLIYIAAGGLLAIALLGIGLTNDAWPTLRQSLRDLVGGDLSLGALATLVVAVALVVFAALVLRRSRRAGEGTGATAPASFWLGIAFVVFCGLMILASWLQAHAVRSEFLAEKLEQQSVIARLKAQQVDDWSYERGLDMRFLVDTLKTLPLDEMDRQPEIKQLADLVLAQFLVGHSERIAVTLSRPDGQSLVSAGTIPDKDRAALVRDIREAARQGRQMRGAIQPGGARPDGLSVTFLVPFKVPSLGGVVEFVAAGLIDPSVGLLRTFNNWPVPNRNSEVELVFRDGNDIVHIVPPGPTPSIPLSFRVPASAPELQALGRNSSGTATDGIDHHGHRVVSAVQNVTAFPWIVIARASYAEAMAPVERQVVNIWMMTGAMIAFAGLFLMALWFQLRLTEMLRVHRLG